METSFTLFEKYPELVYGLAVCILTWIIIYYFIEKPTKNQKFSALMLSGISLGVIFYLIVEVIRWPMMILAFLASVGFYELFIKIIMKYLNKSYQDK